MANLKIPIWQRAKNIVKRIVWGELFIKPQTFIVKLWMGNYYGGFFISPELLNDRSIVYSIGVGEDVSFDLEMINAFGCEVFAFDPTPKSIKWVESQKIPNGFIFSPFGISDRDGDVEFHLSKIEDQDISGSTIVNKYTRDDFITVPMKRISTVMKELGHTHIDVLKMDIEGAEYSVLKNVLNLNLNIGQISVEFHHRTIKDGLALTKEIIRLLNIKGYMIFAVSSNGAEVSFINTLYNRL